MKVRLRVATEADVGPMAELTTQLGYPVETDVLRARLVAVRSRTDDEVLVAVDASDRPLGWVHVGRLALLETSDRACINGLVVDDAHRSAGLGAALVAGAERWARERGATAMIVRSRSTRERAHRFYERIGYVVVKRSHVFEKPLV